MAISCRSTVCESRRSEVTSLRGIAQPWYCIYRSGIVGRPSSHSSANLLARFPPSALTAGDHIVCVGRGCYLLRRSRPSRQSNPTRSSSPRTDNRVRSFVITSSLLSSTRLESQPLTLELGGALYHITNRGVHLPVRSGSPGVA
jgi:hypothetical protein